MNGGWTNWSEHYTFVYDFSLDQFKKKHSNAETYFRNVVVDILHFIFTQPFSFSLTL